MTHPNTNPRAVIEQLVGALEQSTHELKFGNPRTTATDTYRYSNMLIHECEDALTAGREALATQGAEVQNRCVSELLAFAEMNPSTYIFHGWDGSRVSKYLRLLTTHPKASEPMTEQEYEVLTKNGTKAWAGVNAQDLRDGSYPAPCDAGAMCIDCQPRCADGSCPNATSPAPKSQDYMLGFSDGMKEAPDCQCQISGLGDDSAEPHVYTASQPAPSTAGDASPATGTNTGHGHVWARPDGVRMRCGGPRVCSVCASDKAAILQSTALPVPNKAGGVHDTQGS